MRSQNARLIDYLASGRPITPLQALRRFGVFRLAARVSDLRRAGHRIQAELVKRGGRRFGEYRLSR